MPAYKNENKKGKNNIWYAKFRYKDRNGVVKDKTKRGFATKYDAVKWEEDFKKRISGDLNMTLGDFYEIYKAECFPHLKKVTVSEKDYIFRDKILPYFGERKINSIDSLDIAKWQKELLSYRDKNGNPYSKSYLKTVHNQLSALLNHAVKYYKLPNNPAVQAGNIGDESEIHMEFWTYEEFGKFIYEVMDKPIYYYLFMVLYWTGIREGEALALLQSDFDFENKTLSINKTYQVVQGEHLVTTPKNSKSVRTVTLPDFLCDELEEFFSTIPEEMATKRIFYGLSKSMITRCFQNGSKKAGVKQIRVHDLRHSHVSLLIELEYSAVAIATRVGHESVYVARKYSHLFSNKQREIANALNNLAKNMPVKKRDS